MIAFVFWSSPSAEVVSDAFESLLRRFHKDLFVARSETFRASASFRTESVPWMPWVRMMYEDWYVLRDFSGVDHLIDVVRKIDSDDASSPHVRLMQLTASGLGGVYALRSGQPQLQRTPHAWWFDAPSAGEVDEHIRTLDLGRRGVTFSLWVRSLGLGPAKFCLQASEALGDWGPFDAVHRVRTPL
jgi:hypothetical protein